MFHFTFGPLSPASPGGPGLPGRPPSPLRQRQPDHQQQPESPAGQMADGFRLGHLPFLHQLQQGQVHQHRQDDHQDPRKNHPLEISHETTKFGYTA